MEERGAAHWLDSRRGPRRRGLPFWLAVGMLLCCLWTIARWARRQSPLSQSTEPYLDRHALRLFCIGAGSLTLMIASIHIIGVYFAAPLYLIFYMRFLGSHSWRLTGAIAALTPVATFLFFEIALENHAAQGLDGAAVLSAVRFFLLRSID